MSSAGGYSKPAARTTCWLPSSTAPARADHLQAHVADLTPHIIATVSLAIPAMILAETSLAVPRPRHARPCRLLGCPAARRPECASHRVGPVAARPWPGRDPRRGGVQLRRRRSARLRRPLWKEGPVSTEPIADPILEIKDLTVEFATDDKSITAVNGIDVSIRRGSTTCIVGESGSGKSVTARSILRVVGYPGTITGGQIIFRPKPDSDPIDIGAWRQPPDAGLAGRGDRADLPGADGVAVAGPHDRQPDQRGPAPAQRPRQGRDPPARDRRAHWSAFHVPRNASTPTRSSSRAACGSGP